MSSCPWRRRPSIARAKLPVDDYDASVLAGTIAVLLLVVGFGDAADLSADSDGDGLSDHVEMAGWHTADGRTYVTDPRSPDTDGDGLTDAEEAGKQLSADPGTNVYAGHSDPTKVDSDGDGLADADEADFSLNAFASDTDGDGFDDGYEVKNAQSKGLDPLWADVKRSTLQPTRGSSPGVRHLATLRPVTLSPVACRQPCRGRIKLHPGRWLDCRWGGGSAGRGRISHSPGLGGAGFSVVGLVPGAGDAAEVAGKVAEFIARHPELEAAASAAILALKWVPDKPKAAAARSTSPRAWDSLRAKGVREKSLLLLQKGKTSLTILAKAMKLAGHVDGVKAHFFDSGGQSGAFLEDVYPGSQVHVKFSTANCLAVCNPVSRQVDVLTGGVAHESKVGRVFLTPSIKAQIESDAYLIKTGQISGAHWHFFASSVTNTLGATQQVLDLLKERGIPFTYHVPA